MSWLDKLDRKFGRWGIPNLMLYIVITIAAVFIGDVLFFCTGHESERILSAVYTSGCAWTVLAICHFYFCTAHHVDYFIVFLFVFLLFSWQYIGECLGDFPL